MNTDELYRRNLEGILKSVLNAKRIYRNQGAEEILRQPELIPFLIEYLYSNNKDRSIKSAWVLELVCLFEISLVKIDRTKFIQDDY